MENKGQSPLNQFLLNKLKEDNPNGQRNTQNCNGLILPILKFQTAGDLNIDLSGKIEIPLLRGIQQNQSNDNANQLNRILTNLHISEKCSPAPAPTTATAPAVMPAPTPSSTSDIDLSTALASRLTNDKTSILNQAKNAGNTSKASLETDFQIAFIDCEQIEDITKDTAPQQHSDNNQDYRDFKDLPSTSLEAFCAAPSGIGRILNCCSRRYVGPTTAYRTLHPSVTIQAKHKIEQFAFNTKSPDDLIIDALKR